MYKYAVCKVFIPLTSTSVVFKYSVFVYFRPHSPGSVQHVTATAQAERRLPADWLL